MLTITVLVPTYCRPADLTRCLQALKAQSRPADEVIVVVRDTDLDTWQALEPWEQSNGLSLRAVTVTVPGQVAALNAGLDVTQGDILAITDDDAAPRPDWLARIETHFLADPQLGGLGGRDWLCHGEKIERGNHPIVGRVQWFGRIIGNHHLGHGAPREVDLLKGANMSYRRSAIGSLRFDVQLRGTGAQVNNDMAFSMAIKQAGYRLLYDPEVAVDHYEGSRGDGDDRVGHFTSSLSTVFDASYNEARIVLGYLSPVQHLPYLLWSLLIGTRKSPGLVQAVRFTAQFGRVAWERCLTVQRGKFSALLDLWNPS